MTRTELLQEIRKMRFDEAYEGWCQGRLSQEEAARLLGVGERTFRRYLNRYEEAGLQGLMDKRLNQVSQRRAPVDEVMALTALYRSRYSDWNVRHFHSWYRRKRRERSPLPGMMVHQDGSSHAWVADQLWDLIVTMDDATGEHYSMFFVAEEGTWSSLQGVREVIEAHGLFSSFYSDRGSHYWVTPQAGGKVDKLHLTQFGRALGQLDILMIPAYSPEARGRSERAFGTHQGRLPQELRAAGIIDMQAANRYLDQVYRPAFNAEFRVAAREAGSAFVPWAGGRLDEILCEHFERTVDHDNCVRFETLKLQIPADRHRCHYVKTKVAVHRYADGALALFHGPRLLGRYERNGALIEPALKTAA
jgi:transposase